MEKRDSKRSFTRTQKNEILYQQNNKCANIKCRKDLDPRDIEYHHDKPWANGGRTINQNGRALCGSCHNVISHKNRLKHSENDTSEKNNNSKKREKSISKKELLNQLPKTKLRKIVKEFDPGFEDDYLIERSWDKEDYIDFLSSSRKVTVEKIEKILEG